MHIAQRSPTSPEVNMRSSPLWIAGILAAACQTAQQDGGPPASGSTSFVRGTPDTVYSDTVRGARQEPSRSGDVTLTLDLTSYVPGGTVAMRIRNQTSDTLGFNQCSSRVVERQQGAAWILHPEPGRICTMQLQILAPNDTTTATTDLPRDVRAGTYRITLNLSRQSTTNPGMVQAVSPSFRVK
jgi:hypothetical protein